jgi:hypothetical protein
MFPTRKKIVELKKIIQLKHTSQPQQEHPSTSGGE